MSESSADIELCKELFSLSKWNFEGDFKNTPWYSEDGDWQIGFNPDYCIPAYTFNYLTAKLPFEVRYGIKRSYSYRLMSFVDNNDQWVLAYRRQHSNSPDTIIYRQTDELPQNAACRLAIDLFRKGAVS